jgi:hypothetical protein
MTQLLEVWPVLAFLGVQTLACGIWAGKVSTKIETLCQYHRDLVLKHEKMEERIDQLEVDMARLQPRRT